ncbi:MAG TPA: RsmG family class I SAM-dependent methyltransferase [Polyangiaceae bacterium]|nr:RsmG family class I SAM-dependent methyltransferase [Polyangiaceae bacterium]
MPDFNHLIKRALVSLELDPDLPSGRSTRLGLASTWATRVFEWNQRIDLTAARGPEELVDLLIADAAIVANNCSQDSESWLDVGTGAGAPGLGLAVLLPALRIQLLEPKAKRIAFLRTVVGELGIPVRVLRGRSEEQPNGACSVAISRATLPPPQWLEEGARLARHSVWVLLAQADAPALQGWQEAQRLEYRWPLTGVERTALRFERVESEPR